MKMRYLHLLLFFTLIYPIASVNLQWEIQDHEKGTWQPYDQEKPLFLYERTVFRAPLENMNLGENDLFLPGNKNIGRIQAYTEKKKLYENSIPQKSDIRNFFRDVSKSQFIEIHPADGDYLYFAIEPAVIKFAGIRQMPIIEPSHASFKRVISSEFESLLLSAILILLILPLTMGFILFPKARKQLFYLMVLSLSTGGSVLLSSSIIWMFLDNPFYLSLSSYFIVFLPSAIFYFQSEIVKKYKKYFLINGRINLILPVLGIALEVFQLNPINITIVQLVIIPFFIAQIIALPFLFFSAKDGDDNAQLILFGFAIVLITAIPDILRLFLIFVTEQPTYPWGILFFIMILAWIMMREFEKRSTALEEKNETLQSLAFMTSHKLRLPLGNLLGLMNLVNNSRDPATEIAKYYNHISVSARQFDLAVYEIAEKISSADRPFVENKIAYLPELTTIILVDDDEVNNLLNERLLNKVKSDLDIIVYQDGLYAWEAFEKRIIPETETTLIFLDINMPQLNGFELLEKMTMAGIDIPVVMLTSSIDPDDINQALQYKIVVSFISKPLKIEIIKEIFGVDNS